MVTAPAGLAQQGPIRLFPERGTPSPAEPAPEQQLPAPTQPRSTPRTEPVPPEPDGEFTVEGLAAPELDALGLSGPTEGGFDRPLWQGADPDLVMRLLADLPVVTLVPPLRDLTRRLLVTGSPAGAPEPGRCSRRASSGWSPWATWTPPRRWSITCRLQPPTPELARRAAEVALLLGDDQTACRLADSLGPTSGAEFWAEIAVYCRLVEDDASGARLGLDLMREAGQTTDDAFFALATAIVDQIGPPAAADARRTIRDPSRAPGARGVAASGTGSGRCRPAGAGGGGARAGARRRAPIGGARAGVPGRRDFGRPGGGRLYRGGSGGLLPPCWIRSTAGMPRRELPPSPPCSKTPIRRSAASCWMRPGTRRAAPNAS